ncbi:HAMP domain-containing sensor histidine kinase [Konateibacter massiliensis]|uniref:HAMP domain-containing sensor histidine kinase n=1 Tax=Konateibacter massiliensis TaxID=2002841 RepID=UPI000C161A62|nr:HAMP domain-containing sensor histidine kinase [Konateibacter massiliensis]
MRHEKLSLKWKVFQYLLGFTAILLILLWLFQTVYLDSFYTAIKKNELEQALEVLQGNLDAEDLESTINTISEDYEVYILIGNEDGRTLYSSEYYRSFANSVISKEKIQEYFERSKEEGGRIVINHEAPDTMEEIIENAPMPGIGEEETGARPDDAGDDSSRGIPSDIPSDAPQISQEDKPRDFGNKPLFNFRAGEYQNVTYADISTVDGEECIVMVNAQLTPVDATVHTIQVQLICISVLMILLSLGIALLVSKKISRSIVKVNQTAKELANGDFQVEFNGKDYKEITELSDTLNYTAKELGRAENLQRELIANISHDLRTPLTMIIAYSEVMRDLPGENTPENIQVVIDESRRLTNLVNDMLDISKLQAGVMEQKTKEYDLTESIKQIITRYAKLVEQDGYVITFDYNENVWVEADEFKLYQVIYNLINNAINYTGDDKKVSVKQRVDGNRVRIEVTDTGIGIEEKDIKYVWERYYKVDKTHKRAVMGTGLGLSIVKNILVLHEANYGVISEVDQGSTFWFELEWTKTSKSNRVERGFEE